MYHPKYKYTQLVPFVVGALFALGPQLVANAEDLQPPALGNSADHLAASAREIKTSGASGINLSGIAREDNQISDSSLPTLPKAAQLHKKPLQAQLYQYDKSPLGNRQPFLFVHGLRGEYWPCFRWGKVARAFIDDPTFKSKFKIYLLRYDTTVPLAVTVPQFQHAVDSLYNRTGKQQITIVALSMGGNLVYEGMQGDKKTDDAIRYVMTLGTPFHGSPLFCRDWIQYSIYKNLAMPWTRVDHSLAFRLYFRRNPNLQKDLPWDDLDHGIPDVGHFFSLLPLGPSGYLTSAAANSRLANLTDRPFDKKKLVTYGGYLLNPYMRSEPIRIAETTVLAPYTLLTMKVPAHFAREHSVLKMLNCVIGSVVASKPAIENSRTPFVYQLNDGITPVESALFLPHSAFATKGVANEAGLKTLKELTDVRLARVFRNVDHLTFIDGFRPPRASQQLKDELNPESGTKTIFNWMRSDLLAGSSSLTVAEDSSPKVADSDAVPANGQPITPAAAPQTESTAATSSSLKSTD